MEDSNESNGNKKCGSCKAFKLLSNFGVKNNGDIYKTCSFCRERNKQYRLKAHEVAVVNNNGNVNHAVNELKEKIDDFLAGDNNHWKNIFKYSLEVIDEIQNLHEKPFGSSKLCKVVIDNAIDELFKCGEEKYWQNLYYNLNKVSCRFEKIIDNLEYSTC